MKIAVVRGKFLNRYEMQFFEPLVSEFDLTAFGSLAPYHDKFAFPVIKLPSPADLPDFPYKMPLLNRLFIDAHYLWGLENKLKGFDLVHTAETYFHYTQQCLNARKNGYVKKVIATVLENIPFNNEGIRGRKAFKKRAREELDHIIALTQLTKEGLLKEGADPRKITVIGHFIDTKVFYPTEEAQHRRADKNLRKFTILFCGRLEPYKGVYEIVSAAEKLIRDKQLRDYQLSFVFVGDGREKARLLKLEKDLGIKSYITHKQVHYDQMSKGYQQADIFVAPSKATATWQEQYCTVLLEAQACGLPIVTTRSGGIPENIGEAGMVVRPADSPALASAIKKFILDFNLRVRYGQIARKRAVEVHDAKIGAKKLANLYHSLLT